MFCIGDGSVFLYQKKYAENIIDKILNETDDKILYFCNDLRRLGQMYKIYGDQAYYRCSNTSARSSTIPDSVLRKSKKCIRPADDGNITFDKRILFTTTVLDNGVDLKDPALKHIFSEVFKVNRTNSASLNKINQFLQEQNISYMLESQKCKDRGPYRDKTYWIIRAAKNLDV